MVITEMTISEFIFAKAPEIRFGRHMLSRLPHLAGRFGKTVLLVTGSASFCRSAYYRELVDTFHALGMELHQTSITGEPSPAFVDETVGKYRDSNIDVVAGIGGGSAMDAGKAISAMLLQKGSVIQYLEGMETGTHNGVKVPFIAVPTSSGTGSEATKNAVLSEIGEKGFKRSLRHDNFVPDIAIIDPELTLSCPADVTAACGLDTLTQLLEAYVSVKASPMTDALALSGLRHFKAGFLPAFRNGTADIEARENMCYASLISGIVLANAGLGVVHGLASPIGGYFPIPHGVVCGTLLGAATAINIGTMKKNPSQYKEALDKYATAGMILSGKHAANAVEGCELLIDTIEELLEATGISRLGAYGIAKEDIPRIVAKANNKNSPVELSKQQIAEIVENRI